MIWPKGRTASHPGEYAAALQTPEADAAAHNAAADLLAEARSSLHRVDPLGAHEAMQAGAPLIDTRSDHEPAKNGSIPGALRIPLSVLEWRVDPDSDHHDPAIDDFEETMMLIALMAHSSASRRTGSNKSDSHTRPM